MKHTTENTQVASMLLEIKAVRLNTKEPFKWASGWFSPIYCDNRLSLSYPAIRRGIKEQLCELIRHYYPEVEAIAGVATAGIPQAALVAESLELPMLYVRSGSKEHGLQNQIEGKITTGQKVVVIEDLVSTGKSSIQAAEALRSAGFEVLGMAAIFTYNFAIAEENFAKANLPLYCLTDYNTLIDIAVSQHYIAEEELDSLKNWRLHPDTWGK